VILNAQPYWIVVRAARGAAVWLASQGASPLRVYSGEEVAPTELSRLDNWQALLYFHSSLTSVLDTPPVRLFVNGQLANGSSIIAKRRRFDIGAALNASALPAGSGKRLISLEFVSDLRGSITVYPPIIEYEVS
jgi:hypothetical protein